MPTTCRTGGAVPSTGDGRDGPGGRQPGAGRPGHHPRRDLGASHSLAATALAVFSLAMFLSRSAGDAVLSRIGERRPLTAVAVLVAGLITLGFLVARPLVMVIVIGLIGLTLGPVFPVAVYRASRSSPGQAAAMTAKVSAVGYLAYIGGPPLVGFVADTIGLPLTFAAVVLLSCTGIAFARHDPAPVTARSVMTHG